MIHSVSRWGGFEVVSVSDSRQFSEAGHDDSSFGNLAFMADQKINIWTFFWKICQLHSWSGNSNLPVVKEDAGRDHLAEEVCDIAFFIPPRWMVPGTRQLCHSGEILLTRIRRSILEGRSYFLRLTNGFSVFSDLISKIMESVGKQAWWILVREFSSGSLFCVTKYYEGFDDKHYVCLHCNSFSLYHKGWSRCTTVGVLFTAG